MDYSNKINRVSKNLILGTSRATRGAYLNQMELQKSQDPNANRAEIIIKLSQTSWFERLWYPIFFIAGILCLIFIRPFNFELCFAVASLWLYMVANNLLARGKMLGVLISIISASLYVVVSFFAKVYGEVIINVLLYIPLDVIALITFKRNKNNNTQELDVRKLNAKKWLITTGLTILLTAAIFVVLYFIPGQVYPLLNSISISLFLFALFLRNLRFMEFWWFNLLGNLVSIIMWIVISTSAAEMLFSLPFTLSSLAALLNNIYGIVMWQKIYRKEKANGEVFIKKTVKVKQIIKLRHMYKDSFTWNKEVEENHKTQKR